MNIRRITHSIVTRIILLGICIVVIGAIARYFLLTSYLKEDLGRSVQAQQVSLAEYVSEEIAQGLAGRQTMLRELAAAFPLESMHRPDQVRQWLNERNRLQPLFNGSLFVTDLHGRVVAQYSGSAQPLRADYSESDYWQAALRGELTVGSPQRMGPAQKPVLAMAAPIRDAVGKIRAVLVGASLIGVDGFLHLPHPNVLGEGSGFLLVSTRDRLFVASSDEDFILRPTPPHGVNALHDKAMEGFRGGGITVNANGIEEISGIASVPATDWFVVARVPTAVVFASVMRAQRYVAGNGLVVIVGFIVVSLGSLLAIFRPLLKAAEHADRMSLGEIPLELLPVVRDDEVGHLTRSFNRLIGKLQSNQSALERAAHHDPLTGLPNRTLLADRLRQALAIANRSGHNIAVLYMDLDGFKPINDALGHAAGDEALKEVARRLGLLVREADTVARMGGMNS